MLRRNPGTPDTTDGRATARARCGRRPSGARSSSSETARAARRSRSPPARTYGRMMPAATSAWLYGASSSPMSWMSAATTSSSSAPSLQRPRRRLQRMLQTAHRIALQRVLQLARARRASRRAVRARIRARIARAAGSPRACRPAIRRKLTILSGARCSMSRSVFHRVNGLSTSFGGLDARPGARADALGRRARPPRICTAALSISGVG